jgi:HEAT repeat protein
LLEVGRFLEAHGSQAEVLGRVVNLKVCRGWRGGARRWARWPLVRLDRFLEPARERGIDDFVLVEEDGEATGRVLPRRAVACGLRVESKRSSGPDAAPAAPRLLKAIEDSDLEVRRTAIEALGKIGPAARVAALEVGPRR